MKKQYHILNGDSLKQQFPKDIDGEIIVMREALVDGPVDANDLTEFFNLRAEFISSYYGETVEGYQQKSASEISKIPEIDPGSDINLWFEDDLFCQVNCWFVVNLLHHQGKKNPVFLIRPDTFNPYGFGGLDHKSLEAIYQKRALLPDLAPLANLWEAYKKADGNGLKLLSHKFREQYPFIVDAVYAHLDRFPVNGDPGRPIRSLLRIMEELHTSDFAEVFREFNKREAIYGFGDLHVKKLFDKALDLC